MALTARSRSFTNLVPLFGNISVSTLLLSGSPHSHSTSHSLVSFSFLRLYSYFQLTRSLHSPSPPSLLFTLSLRAANSSNATINPVPRPRVNLHHLVYSHRFPLSPLFHHPLSVKGTCCTSSNHLLSGLSFSLSNTLHCPICFRSRMPCLISHSILSSLINFPRSIPHSASCLITTILCRFNLL